MAEQLHRVQVIGLPTLVPRSPVPERDDMVKAAAAGGASCHQRHPDMPAPGYEPSERDAARGRKSRISPPPPIDPPTGPPPTFEANVLEVQARDQLPTVRADKGAMDPPRPVDASQRQWQAPAMPEPALINLQL